MHRLLCLALLLAACSDKSTQTQDTTADTEGSAADTTADPDGSSQDDGSAEGSGIVG